MKERSKRKKSVSQDDFKSALVKKALGYDTTEIVEEYVGGEEGEIKLTKKKVTTKNVPPDITAIKMLMEESQKPVETMSDEELEEERQRLLKILISDAEKGVKN